MYLRVYNLLGWLLILVAMPFFVPYYVLSGGSLAGLRQRFGDFVPDRSWQHTTRLWLHAASVGEVQAAVALVAALKELGGEADIIITTVTEQGLLAARRHLGNQALCLYAPIDLAWVVERFLLKLKPTAYLCLETELWPNMLSRAKAHGVKTLLLNGRLSERTFYRYQKIVGFMGQVLGCFDAVAVIQAVDRDRYVALGCPPERISVLGNVKYDMPMAAVALENQELAELHGMALDEAIDRHYRERLGLAKDQPVLLAGSTHSGEEAILLDVYEALTSTLAGLVLLVAPRHLDRLVQITADWQRRGVAFQTYSHVLLTSRTASIIVIDRMGELARLYAVATYVFCGGSLVPRGGHNIMEAAILGKSPFYGPSMADFADARLLLESASAGFTIHSGQELIEGILYFHRHPDEHRQAGQRALRAALEQQGAAGRQAELIRQTLGETAHFKVATM